MKKSYHERFGHPMIQNRRRETARMCFKRENEQIRMDFSSVLFSPVTAYAAPGTLSKSKDLLSLVGLTASLKFARDTPAGYRGYAQQI